MPTRIQVAGIPGLCRGSFGAHIGAKGMYYPKGDDGKKRWKV